MNKLQKKWILMGSIVLLGTMSAFADPSGAEIMQAVYDRPQGKDTSGTLVMTLMDSRGGTRVREIKQILGRFGSVDKKLMVFQSPADVRGTAFMNWSYKEGGKSDDQWIYLPALKRVKRISSEGKGDYFMGSDFTYDDLGDRHPSEDRHQLVRSETVNGEDCWVVESVPRDSKYMYSKTITWVSKQKMVGLQREYYDQKGKHLKDLTIDRVDQIAGFWIITKTEMKNVEKNTKTVMEFSNVTVDTGLREDLFTERTLTRGL